MRWPIERSILERLLICAQNPIDPVALGVEDVTVESEAVRGCLGMLEFGAETEERELFIGVVVLQDISNRLQSLVILIVLQVPRVERVWTLGIPITESEINRDGQVELTATENVFEEAVPLLDAQLVERESSRGFCELESFALVGLKFIHGEGNLAQIRVSSTLAGSEHLDLHLPV